MPLLLKSTDPRLLFVAGLSNITKASESYFPTPAQPSGWPKKIDFETIGYRCSKMALSMLMVDWNHKLQADGVKVWSVMPGFLATNLGGVPDLATCYHLLNKPDPATEIADAERLIEELRYGVEFLGVSLKSDVIFEGVGGMGREIESAYLAAFTDCTEI